MERKKDVTQQNGFNNQQPIVTVEINHSNKTRMKKNTKNFIPFSSKQLWTIGILLVLAVGAWIIPSVIDNSSRDEEAIQPIETVNEEANTASDEPISATSSRPINHTDFNDVNFSEENKSDIKTSSRPKSTIPQFSHNNIKLQSPKVQQHIAMTVLILRQLKTPILILTNLNGCRNKNSANTIFWKWLLITSHCAYGVTLSLLATDIYSNHKKCLIILANSTGTLLNQLMLKKNFPTLNEKTPAYFENYMIELN